MTCKWKVGDYVIVKRGHNIGMHGEITDIIEPFDGGVPIALIDVRGIDEVGICVDRIERMKRPDETPAR